MEGVVVINKVMAMSVAVLLLFDFAYSATTTCTTIASQFQPCLADLQSNATTPSSTCCSGLAAIQSSELQIGVNPTCNCTKGLILQVPGLTIDVMYSTNIQNSCSVSLGFSLSTNSGC